MSTALPADALDALGAHDELEVSSFRPDGSLRPFVTIWGVAADGDGYLRSAYGPQNGWFRRALAAGRGRIRIAGGEWDVAFAQVDADDAVQRAIDDAYRAAYGGRYAANIVASVVGAQAATATVRLRAA